MTGLALTGEQPLGSKFTIEQKKPHNVYIIVAVNRYSRTGCIATTAAWVKCVNIIAIFIIFCYK